MQGMRSELPKAIAVGVNNICRGLARPFQIVCTTPTEVAPPFFAFVAKRVGGKDVDNAKMLSGILGGSEWESNPPNAGQTCVPPVLKITWSVLSGYENSLLYLILQRLTTWPV